MEDYTLFQGGFIRQDTVQPRGNRPTSEHASDCDGKHRFIGTCPFTSRINMGVIHHPKPVGVVRRVFITALLALLAVVVAMIATAGILSLIWAAIKVTGGGLP